MYNLVASAGAQAQQDGHLRLAEVKISIFEISSTDFRPKRQPAPKRGFRGRAVLCVDDQFVLLSFPDGPGNELPGIHYRLA
jgi:hypothetical protein